MTNALLLNNSDRPLVAAGIASAAGRLLIALIFVLSGVAKIGSPSGTIAYIASAGLPLPSAAFVVAVGIELVGGLLLILGYRTRAAAFVLAIFTTVAAVGFHFDFADQNQFIHFFKNAALIGGLLQVIAFGPGPLSIDARR